MSTQFKRISREPAELVDLKFSVKTVQALDALAEKAAEEIGLDITIEDVVRLLIKKHLAQTAPRTPEQIQAGEMNVMDQQAQVLMALGEKIQAIKLVREKSGKSLVEAKNYVESRWNAEFEKARFERARKDSWPVPTTNATQPWPTS